MMERRMKALILGLMLAALGVGSAALAGPPPDWPPRQLADTITLPRWVSYSRPGLPLAGYFPDRAVRAGLGGEALIHCRVDGRGRLAGCQVLSDTPREMGFGQAALAIAPWLTVDVAAAGGAPVVNGEADLPITFGAPKAVWDDEVTRPDWAQRPTAADVTNAYRAFVEDQRGGDAAVRCVVSAAGLLIRCVITRQSDTPFGKAALSLTPNFRLLPLDTKGLPVAGREIVVPFQFEPD
jgi:TonB family protein